MRHTSPLPRSVPVSGVPPTLHCALQSAVENLYVWLQPVMLLPALQKYPSVPSGQVVLMVQSGDGMSAGSEVHCSAQSTAGKGPSARGRQPAAARPEVHA